MVKDTNAALRHFFSGGRMAFRITKTVAYLIDSYDFDQ